MNAFDKSMAEVYAKEKIAMEKTARPRGTDSAKVIPVIRTVSLKGRGTDDDPVGRVVQFWTLKGKLLATIAECELNGCE